MLRVLSFICRIIRPEAGSLLYFLAGGQKLKNKPELQESEGEPGDSEYNQPHSTTENRLNHFYHWNLNNVVSLLEREGGKTGGRGKEMLICQDL